MKPIALVALALLLNSYSPSAGQPLDPKIREKIGIDQKLGDQLPLDLRFIDETGQSISLGQFFTDKPVLLILAYYECPMLCTQVLNGTVRGLKPLNFTIGEDFEVVTVSIDPDETPDLAAAKKKEYVQLYGREQAAKGWHFLTGDQEQITRLAKAVGFNYEYDEKTDQFIHASGIMLVTADGQLSRYFYGIDYTPKDLKLGLIDSSDGKIGSPVEKLLLLCYSYNPLTGKYGVIIFSSMRALGVITVLVLGTFIFIMLRRERHDNAHSAAV